MAEIERRRIQWLWRHWLARGSLSILDGDPGLGKSSITLDLAARVSRGWAMPPAGGPAEGIAPAGVLLLSAEDDPSRTIRPRLDAVEADVSRVHLLAAMTAGDETRPPVLPWDLDSVEGTIRDRGVSLVVIDPFLAYLDGEVDAHKDQDVRRCLHRLADLAHRTDAAILLVRHLNKLNHTVALYRGGGSIGILGACRSALIVGRHPDQQGVMVVASNKSNLGPRPRSLTYTIDPVGDVARIAWGAETDLLAHDILAHPDPGGGSGKVDRCADLIRATLAGGPMPVRELTELCEAAGYSPGTVKRARQRAGVQAGPSAFGAGWIVRLPTPEGGAQCGAADPEHNGDAPH
jgi:hypothetical protein